jgi:hypothetical protein
MCVVFVSRIDNLLIAVDRVLAELCIREDDDMAETSEMFVDSLSRIQLKKMRRNTKKLWIYICRILFHFKIVFLLEFCRRF